MSAPVATNPVETFTPLSPATVGGRRRGSKKLKLVTKKQARKMLKSMGKRMRGGKDDDPVVVETPVSTASTGGRGRRGTKKTRRHGKRRSLFGMRY